MKVLALTDAYRDTCSNGSEVFCSSMIDRLGAHHEVDVVARAARDGGSRQPRFAIDEALIHDGAALASYLEREIDLADYDLVYNAGALLFGCHLATLIERISPGIPLVNHFQALLGPYSNAEGLVPELEALHEAGQKDAAQRATVNIFASQAEYAAALRSGMKIDDASVVVIPNGLPPDEFDGVQPNYSFLPPARRESPPTIVVTAGRFADFTKGADLIYRAFVRVRQELDDVFLLSVTNSNRFAYVLRDAPADSYRVLEWRSRSEFLSLLAAADVVVLPSRYEPFGLIAIEAMSLGVPVIANSVGGLCETVGHGIHGLLNPKEQGSLGLAAAMLSLLPDRDRMRAMGAAARTWARSEYSIDRVSALVDKALRRALLAAEVAYR